MSPAQTTVAILVLAFLCESMVEYFLSPIIKSGKLPVEAGRSVTLYSAALAGMGLAWLFSLDLFGEFLGLQARLPVASVLLTGLVIGRGSNYVHDIFKRIRGDDAPPTVLVATLPKD